MFNPSVSRDDGRHAQGCFSLRRREEGTVHTVQCVSAVTKYHNMIVCRSQANTCFVKTLQSEK